MLQSLLHNTPRIDVAYRAKPYCARATVLVCHAARAEHLDTLHCGHIFYPPQPGLIRMVHAVIVKYVQHFVPTQVSKELLKVVVNYGTCRVLQAVQALPRYVLVHISVR